MDAQGGWIEDRRGRGVCRRGRRLRRGGGVVVVVMHLIGSGVRGWSGREGVVASGGERHGTDDGRGEARRGGDGRGEEGAW